MQRATASLCIAMQMFLLCFAPSCPSAQKYPKCWHDRHTQIRQKQHSMKTFCDPSFSNQTAGAVTQKCSSGFYREWAGPNRGQCVPCSCNGLSNECDERTGHCVKCQFNTTGDRCERCKEGYYGNPANRACHACPCPFTENNFALACLDVGSGVVECLCKHGYSGVRCERCAFGYYGNPLVHRGICKPCSCQENGLNMCDSLTGECIQPGNSGCGDHCGGCDTCTHTLLVDLEQKDVDLFWLKKQLQNSSYNPVSWSSLNNLEADISEAKIQMGRYGAAVRLLNPNVEQLEADVAVDRYDLYQLIDENLHIAPYLKKVLESANETKLKAEDLCEAGFLLTTIHDLIKRLTEVKPEDSVSLSEKDKRWMMEEARRTAQEMRDRGCTAQRDKAGNEQDEAHKLLDLINNDVIVPAKMNQFILIQSADSVMATDAAVREVDKLLLNAEDTVDTAQGLNLKSHTTLQHLQALKAQLDKEQSTVPPVTEMTKDLLKNITGIISVIEEIKKGFENQSAQLDGAKPKLFKKLNNSLQMMAKVETITKAKEHAEELNRVATELQQVLHTTTNGTLLDSLLATEAYDSIINAVGMAEKAANESKKTAGQASKDVKKGGLVTRAEQLKNYSTHLWREASDTQSHLKMLLSTVNAHRNRVKKQKKKGESLRMDTSAIGDSLKKISREDTAVLIGSVREAACAANSAVSNAKERLRNISEEVGRITSTNISVNIEDILTDADQAVKSFNKAFPVMSDKLAQVKALARKMSPKPNMTESIQRIKDIIEETRNFVIMVSLATTFNGKGHTELHPPRNLEDVKAFTAVDLLLNRHHKHPSKSDARRKQRQDKHRDANHFVFYLGNKNALGDYIGMAVRSNVLVCVYKLGGVVHEVETSKITVTNVNSSDFDRVIFHRVYQDAEVNITQNFTSQKPISLPPKRNLPNQMAGVLDLDPDSIVFYVGGYPDDFTPPVELRYPRYRGAIKFSHLNGNPICLYNYKHAVNMDAKQRTVKIAKQELSDYYEGRGYRMAFIKDPGRKKRRLFKFHTNSREINALLFYIGNEESFFCVFVERGFLVLQGQQADREIRLQSSERVSLFDTQFAIVIADKFTVHYGPKKISTDHIQTNYMNYYVGGLPAQLRERHNITAAPLRGCVDHLTADAEIVEYNRTIGVGNGCPVSLLGVRAATLNSSLSVDSLLVWDEQPVRVSLSFRSTGKQGVILKSSSQGSEPISNLQLSLADGFVVFHSFNHTLRSDERYNDGVWHYLSAVGKPSGLMLNIDNVNVRPGHSDQIRLQGGKFRGCVANLYTSRSSILPADLSSLSQAGDIVFGQCSLPLHPNSTMKRSQTHNPTLAGSQCRPQRANQLYEEDSWVSYTLPQEDLNYRPHFSLDIKTKSPKGLILHIAGRGTIPLLALYMANGKIKMSLGRNRIIQHKERSNDGNWHRVEFSVEKSTFHLLVDGIRVTDGHLLDSEGSSLNLDNPVYLGADTKSRITKGHSIPTNTVISCIREFKMNDVFVGAPEVSHKASPCFDGLTEEGTYFGGGHIILDNYFTVGSHFELSFELRPQQLTGLLFHVQSDETSLNVFLMENKVGVKVNDGNGAVSISVTPRKSLCDGTFHEVTVSKQNKVIRLVVDSTSQEKAGPRSTWYSTALDSLYIGGTTNQNGAPVSSPFVGCLRKVEINGKLVAFERDSRVVHPVSINRCPAN